MTMDSKEVGKIIKAAREAKGLSQGKLGGLIGVKQASIFSIENGDTARSKFLPELAKVLDLAPEQIGLPAGSVATAEPATIHRAVTQEVFPGPDVDFDRHGPRDIPVLGTAMGGTEDDERPVDFWLTGEIENHVLRPKGLANARNVFVLHVGGDSMEPRFEERDMVYVQKTSPGIGDDVVIELHPLVEGGDHPTFIKRLVRRNGSFITVKQYNPPKELEFTVKEIKNLFRVIPLKELMG
ncbi:MAG: putative phage repressor [Rhizobium sp.]|nr:putative phage repressor [Rhizobium sp.]